MKEINFKEGEIIHKAGDIADTLDYIISGKVEIRTESASTSVKKGVVLGILEQAGTPYSYDYVAASDVTAVVYPFTRFSDVNQIVDDYFNDCDVIITATSNLVMSLSSKYNQLKRAAHRFYKGLNKQYNRYKELCGMYNAEIQSFPFLENASEFVPMKDMPDWINDYYDQLEIMPREAKRAFFTTHSSFTTAAIWEAVSHAQLYLSLITQVTDYAHSTISDYFYSSKSDIFDLFLNLLNKRGDKKDLRIEIKDCVTDLFDDWDGNILIPTDKLDEKKLILNSLISQINSMNDANSDFNTTDAIEDELDHANMDTDEPSSARYALIKDSLDVILRYTNTDEAEDDRFRQMVSEFKALQDKNSSSENVSNLRKDITKSFLDIYESAIISSFEAPKIPTILKMFFYFGYMDEELIGKDNALLLYDMAEKMSNNMSSAENIGVYTIYDWLKAVYTGKVEPSKNELDQDYTAFIKSQRASGYISADMEKRYMTSNKEKLRFEIRNFFKTGVRVCSGRPSTFCPILSDHNIIKPLEAMLVTVDNLNKNWNTIKAIDYSAFYRMCAFQSPEHRISRETIMLEVMPNVILMPTIGAKALLWQETGDLRRDTPGRIAMPIFTDTDLFLLQLKLTAEFRWEMCKRVQGGRWNDVSERSLTSDYFDYLQFYKKNTDLSPDAKEKIRTQLSNNRNNFKNVFIADYITWIRYESMGSPRLNKVVKNIMFSYCPFSKPLRDKLKTNPMYETMVNRHEIKAAKELKSLTARYNKLTDKLETLPREMLEFLKYHTK